jgi:DNA-binding response OmpR family regulator
MNARRNHILLLDSDEQALVDLQQELEEDGFNITTTWDSAEALKLAHSRQFDLLMVSDHPPQVTGSEILRELQCIRVNLPCVILQTGKNTFDPEYFYSLGAAGVIADRRPSEVARWLRQRLGERAAAAAG